MKIVDLKFKRFGKLKATGEVVSSGGRKKWLCQCDCGKSTYVMTNHLVSGHTKSCGCQRGITHRKYGEFATRESREYVTWLKIKNRCYNPDYHNFKFYGGRGIKMCDEWLDFSNFLSDMGNKPTPNHSIDRIDNNGDYCPTNCRWADAITQANNKSSNVLLGLDGVEKPLSLWARQKGISRSTILKRIKLGWPMSKTLTAPIRKWSKTK
jgi:hypothetical protein